MNEALEKSPEYESDDDLIDLIGMKNEFPQEAMDAYGKIYQRYWDVMYYVARGVTRDEPTAEDLVADTFNMVYNKASTFKKGKIRNPSNIRLSIQKWMTTIMQRIFYDNYLDEAYRDHRDAGNSKESYIIEKKHIIKHLQDDYEGFIDQLEQEELYQENEQTNVVDDERISENELKITKYLASLPERDRDIILTSYNYHIPGKYTPSEVLDELEKKWDTTRDNIRKILQKFRKSIKEELQTKLFIRK